MGVTRIEAQNYLVQMNLADYPVNMKPEERNKFHREMTLAAYNEKMYSSKEAAEIIKAKLKNRNG